MAGELIAQMAQNALTNVGPFGNFMAGAQDYNTLQNQLLNNQLLKQRYAQTEQMNPLLMQEAQQNLALGGQNVAAGQMKLDQAKQGQLIRDMQTIATEALQIPGNARRQHILGRLKTVDFAGLDENELINEISQLDDTQLEQSLRSMMSAADTSEQTAEMRTFNAMTQGMTPEEKAGARKVWAGLQPRAGESAQERIARTGMTGDIAQSEAQIEGAKAGATESAKLEQKLAKEPELEARKTSATEAAKLEAKIKDKVATAGRDAESVNSILDMAEELIPLSTQSGVGTAADVAAGMVGVSTKGAEVADSLKTLEGALIMKMPRMEGPQSNYDVELYRQMAARIGDSTVPAPRRIAALKTLRELTNKYAMKTDKAQKPAGAQTNQFKSASGITFTVE